MTKLRLLLKKIHTPITIMLIPHSRFNSVNFKVPFILILFVLFLSCVGAVYTISLSAQAVEYYSMKSKYDHLSRELNEMETTMSSLKKAESQFRRLFALNSKKDVLNNFSADDEGSIDIEALKQQIKVSMDSVKEINAYLEKQQDAFLATPQGWPASGRISSGYGMREHPKYGKQKFHSGIDIPLPTGTPIHATADGVVSFSDRSAGNGNIVAIEHGHGFSTVYAHNSRNIAKAGQTVKRGQIIAYSGATGVTTGPHIHYEVWLKDKSVNPAKYLEGKAQ
jgi:murein DD-endopeptidase MepM/ murein hydrolase activator NlpD